MRHPLVPNPLRSEAEYRRFSHCDLEDLTDRELWREMWRMEHAIAHEDDAPEWLWERLQALAEEQQHRARRKRSARLHC